MAMQVHPHLSIKILDAIGATLTIRYTIYYMRSNMIDMKYKVVGHYQESGSVR
jgi:hypothetical protein